MSQKVLVFFPTGLNTPEAEVLSSTIQSLLDQKKHVTILTCTGGKNYSCAKNIFSINLICTLCKKKRNEYFKKIVGNFKIIETPKFKKSKRQISFSKNINLKKYFYKNLDNGLATYSSYLALTKDLFLNGFFAKNIISKNLNVTNFLSDFYYKFISKNKFTEVYSFNCRMNLYRPLLRLCSKLDIKFNNLECITGNQIFRTRVINFHDSLPTDFDKIPKIINSYWVNKKDKKREKIINRYYYLISRKKEGSDNIKSYLAKQELGKLPNNWKNNMYNITYFVTSEDEYETVIKKNYKPIFKNQNQTILEISKIIKDQKDFVLWIRMHPNMEDNNWKYVKDLYELEYKFKNIFIISPSSKISTNSLIENSNLNIGLNSRTLLESIFNNKPTIILGKTYWNQIGNCLVIKNKQQLRKILLSKIIPLSNKIVPRKFAYFWSTYGTINKYLTGQFLFNKKNEVIDHSFKFKNSSICFSKLDSFIYLILKSTEKVLIYFNYKLSVNK
jgi:hypothetical protein